MYLFFGLFGSLQKSQFLFHFLNWSKGEQSILVGPVLQNNGTRSSFFKGELNLLNSRVPLGQVCESFCSTSPAGEKWLSHEK